MADFDVVKLIDIIKLNPIIYDHTLKEYADRIKVDHAWRQIAKEFNTSAEECRSKWRNIRNSYARALRNSNQSGRQWYLFDKMSFVKNFSKTSKKTDKQPQESSTSNIQNVIITKSEVEDFSSESEEDVDYKSEYQSSPKRFKSETQYNSGLEVLGVRNVDDEPNLCFFKSLLPDLRTLSARGQRQFKEQVITILNDLLDKEEMARVEAISFTSFS